MALSNNPNKTKRIESAWLKQITLRWSEFSKATGKIPLTTITTNADDEEQSNIDAFIASLTALATSLLLGGNNGEWQNQYQTLAYEQSAERATEQAKPILTPEQVLFLTATVGSQFMLLPENRNELTFLHERANDSLKKWIVALTSEVTTIIQDGLNNLPIDELTAEIQKRIDVSESRARTIAVTEVSQASRRAVINQAVIMNKYLDDDFGVRWITMRDSIVRHLHAKWHGVVMTVKQAAINSNISPWNCRCGLRIVKLNAQSEKVNYRFDTERAALLKMERK